MYHSNPVWSESDLSVRLDVQTTPNRSLQLQYLGKANLSIINKITKLQRRVCYLILRTDQNWIEDWDRLKMLSFCESIFLQISNTIAPEYLSELFKMRSANSNNIGSNLRSVSNRILYQNLELICLRAYSFITLSCVKLE